MLNAPLLTSAGSRGKAVGKTRSEHGMVGLAEDAPQPDHTLAVALILGALAFPEMDHVNAAPLKWLPHGKSNLYKKRMHEAAERGSGASEQVGWDAVFASSATALDLGEAALELGERGHTSTSARPVPEMLLGGQGLLLDRGRRALASLVKGSEVLAPTLPDSELVGREAPVAKAKHGQGEGLLATNNALDQRVKLAQVSARSRLSGRLLQAGDEGSSGLANGLPQLKSRHGKGMLGKSGGHRVLVKVVAPSLLGLDRPAARRGPPGLEAVAHEQGGKHLATLEPHGAPRLPLLNDAPGIGIDPWRLAPSLGRAESTENAHQLILKIKPVGVNRGLPGRTGDGLNGLADGRRSPRVAKLVD
eukprot:9777316-Alexandrium_andersonii.AAC.1